MGNMVRDGEHFANEPRELIDVCLNCTNPKDECDKCGAYLAMYEKVCEARKSRRLQHHPFQGKMLTFKEFAPIVGLSSAWISELVRKGKTMDEIWQKYKGAPIVEADSLCSSCGKPKEDKLYKYCTVCREGRQERKRRRINKLVKLYPFQDGMITVKDFALRMGRSVACVRYHLSRCESLDKVADYFKAKDDGVFLTRNCKLYPFRGRETSVSTFANRIGVSASLVWEQMQQGMTLDEIYMDQTAKRKERMRRGESRD